MTMKNIYSIYKLITIIILFNLIVLLENILYNFFLFKDISNLNYSFVMINKNENNNEVDPSSFSGNIESNINNESKRIERIESWFNKGWLDDKRKEELIKSGKDFDKKELDIWLMQQDKQEYLLNQQEEQEKIKKIHEWLDNVKEPTSAQEDMKPSSKPSSQWSPSGSEEGNPSIPNINSNMDQIKDYLNSSEFFSDINYLMVPEYFIIYASCFFIVFICFLMIYYVVEKKNYLS